MALIKMKTYVRVCILAVGHLTVILSVVLTKSLIFEPAGKLPERSVHVHVPGFADVASLHPTVAEFVARPSSYEPSRTFLLEPTPSPGGTSDERSFQTPLSTPEVRSLTEATRNDCCRMSEGISLEAHCNGSDSLVLQGCSCVDALLCRMVAVTSLSSNHFPEAQDNIGSLQRYFPRTKIIVYDIGLTHAERRQLATYCNVEVRNFTFEKYPDHVRHLVTYAWKPIVVSDVARENEVILYGDSSVRMKSSNAAAVMESLVRFPFVSGVPHSQPIVSLTHDGMMKYLHAPPRKDLVHFLGTQGGVWLMWANRMMKTRVIAPWLDCALHEECISPDGSLLGPCNFTQEAFGQGAYVGCHRYDQSALNMIIAREFGPSISAQISSWSLSGQLWDLNRKATSDFAIKHCNQ